MSGVKQADKASQTIFKAVQNKEMSNKQGETKHVNS